MNRIISSSPLVLVLCLFVLGLAPKMAQAEWVNMSSYDFTNPNNIQKVDADKVVVSQEKLSIARYLVGPNGFADYDITTMVVFIPDDADVYNMVDPDKNTMGTMYLYPSCSILDGNYINICTHVGEVAGTVSGGNPAAFDYMWFNTLK